MGFEKAIEALTLAGVVAEDNLKVALAAGEPEAIAEIRDRITELTEAVQMLRKDPCHETNRGCQAHSEGKPTGEAEAGKSAPVVGSTGGGPKRSGGTRTPAPNAVDTGTGDHPGTTADAGECREAGGECGGAAFQNAGLVSAREHGVARGVECAGQHAEGSGGVTVDDPWGWHPGPSTSTEPAVGRSCSTCIYEDRPCNSWPCCECKEKSRWSQSAGGTI
jgi:hypothetical protein